MEDIEAPGATFQILTWWKVNSGKFPVLSQIARDVLVILITTVASESAFSTGGHFLDVYWSSLSLTTIEALVCIQNWLSSTPIEIDTVDAQSYRLESDIILVYSKNVEDHESHLRMVVGKLKEHQLFAKLNKSEFWLEKAKFFGHVISREGVTVDSSKIEVVMEWQHPIMIHEVRSFLGLAGYNRRFVKRFSKLSCSLMTLTRTNVKFIWTKQCEQSFEELKRRLTIAPVLALPEPYKPFVVYSDASNYGLGCVLTQEGRVLAYVSRQSKELELAAVVFT
ncbi:hypothetical protein F2P56_030562 [Juglans regia]|uniref:Uncharacterized protein n=2 Tax=Juglans regia TaxID=51240 RepID=A0A833U1N1_JUGRE|nr:uncharacterized mitochondrial protein AtMg00860-like [Juglans regia]KAF5450192.1 hypothetical protein F2P56_030562 [Juglans regia]